MNGRLRVVPFAVGVRRREADIEPGLGEQALLDADDDRQVEHLIVGGDPDDGLILG